MNYNIYNAIEQDYSKWLNIIPNQLGWSIEHGNQIFERLKNRFAKKSLVRSIELIYQK